MSHDASSSSPQHLFQSSFHRECSHAYSPLPSLQNPIDGLLQIAHKDLRILRGREVAQPFHGREVGALDLVRGGLGHLGRGRPVVDARQEVDRALGDVDLVHAVPGVEAAEVEVEVAVEDACWIESQGIGGMIECKGTEGRSGREWREDM